MLQRACPNNLEHFLHPSQKYCKECGADAITVEHYECQRCGWTTWNPSFDSSCPRCGAIVFEPEPVFGARR